MKKTNCFLIGVGLIVLVVMSLGSCAGQEDETANESVTTDSIQVHPTPPATLDSLIEYTADDIRQVENRAHFTLEYTWSYESTDDDHKAFYIPRDIEIGANGEIYVLDTGNNRIQVFDSTRTYLRTLGEEGTAPGEFQMPQDLLCIPPDRILVTQPFQKRVQIINCAGEYVQGFVTEGTIEEMKLFDDGELISIDSRREGNPEHRLFRILNLRGDYIRGLGTHKYVEESPDYALEYTSFDINVEKNIYAGYIKRNYIENYTSSGELVQSIYFESPANTADINEGIDDLEFSNGYLYALIYNRQKTQNEKMTGSTMSIGPGNPHYFMKHGVIAEDTDLYRLLIFDRWGRLVSNNLLTKYVNKITVHQNTLYLVDSFVGMKIYEYDIHLPS